MLVSLMNTTAPEQTQVALAQDHQHLEEMFCKLAHEMRTNDRSKLRALWTEFENELLKHLRFEEEALIPRFAVDHANAARLLLLDHDLIRQMMLEIGVGIDLHLVRADSSDRFISFLRAHAAREDTLFYPWIAKSTGIKAPAQFTR